MPKITISRSKVYFLILFINLVFQIPRLFFFADQGLSFHVMIFLSAFIANVLLWEIILLIGKFLDRFLTVARHPDLRIVVQVIITFVISLLLGASLSLFTQPYDVEVPPAVLAVMPVINMLAAIIFNLVYFSSHYFQEWKNKLIQSESLLREQAEMRYNTLRNQLNPHFLFNALTSLNSLIFENQQLASDFLKQLSKVYRYTLQNNETVSLKTEIEFIKHYIFLIETRFSSAVNFSISIDEKEFDQGIVPVTTQMLIENAVKHNILSLSNPLQISIFTQNSFLVVTNSVNKKKQVETSNKVGLESLSNLYKYLSDQPIEIIETEKLFTVKIPLI